MKIEPKTSFCHELEQMVVVPTKLLRPIRKWTFEIYYSYVVKQFRLRIERYTFDWVVEHPLMIHLPASVDSTNDDYLVSYGFPERVAEDVKRRCYQILRILHDQQKETS